MKIADRLKLWIETSGMTYSSVEKAAGLSNGYIKKLHRAPSTEKCEEILKAFPTLSRDWLLRGEGDMYVTKEKDQEEETVSGSIPEGSVVLPSDAWDVIKQQAASLERKDRQIDRVISMIETELKKSVAREEDAAGSADAV